MSVTDRIKSFVTISPQGIQENNDTTYDTVRKIKRLISHNALVPVVCEDMFIYTNPISGEIQSLNSYIVEYIIKLYSKKGYEFKLSESQIDDILSNGYFGLSFLRNEIGYDIYEDVYSAIMDDDDNLIRGIGIKSEVLDFLNVANFPLIITTNCFPIIEKFLDGYESYYNHLETRNDSPLPQKCVYHIFGEARLEDPNWGYDDKQLLNYLRSIFSTEYALKNLTTSICQGRSRKTFLILGNGAPDWLFRFILTPIYGGDVYDNVKGLYIKSKDRTDDVTLDLFLHDIKFDKEVDFVNILSDVTASLREKTPFFTTENDEEIQYDIFISHASEDSDAIKKLVNHLRNNGLRVWVDLENLKDGNYWQRIIDALKRSKYFMPFVTEKFILKNKKRIDILNVLCSKGLALNDISLDSSLCIKMESILDGVQIELLMADIWHKHIQRDPYSLPVILKGSTVFFSPLDPAYIRVCAEESRLLPQSLFWGLQIHIFSEDDIASFSLDYSRYKS